MLEPIVSKEFENGCGWKLDLYKPTDSENREVPNPGSTKHSVWLVEPEVYVIETSPSGSRTGHIFEDQDRMLGWLMNWSAKWCLDFMSEMKDKGLI